LGRAGACGLQDGSLPLCVNDVKHGL
jgi:hypothetical protein